MILVCHPFGNANVRAVLETLTRAELLGKYFTTLGWPAGHPALKMLPARWHRKLSRRSYAIAPNKFEAHPARELVRLVGGRLIPTLTEHERGWASVDAVWNTLDREAAARLREATELRAITAVYSYEDCAEQLFATARERSLRRIYDLPIAYWETSQRLLREEAERWPDWEPTLVGTRDSAEKLARKTRELELAELVICPSAFVLESLPETARASKRCVIAPFGSPVGIETAGEQSARDERKGRLRILFAGSMTQRKGLADVFAAMKLVDSAQIELVVMGSPLRPLGWYREQFAGFTYEPPRPHAEVLRLMQSCDALVLPSIVEGRALVQGEALACGLPVIATRHAGADDLIIDGENGFLVPIRAPERLAEKIEWLARHRERLRGMRIASQAKAREFTWRGYGETILTAIRALLHS